jgi:hypothetical protein
VRDLQGGVLGEVLFDFQPVILIAADALAIGANRHQALQLPCLRQGGFQLVRSLGQLTLSGHGALADMHPRLPGSVANRTRHAI